MRLTDRAGFTLIELVLTIVLVALAAAMLMPFMGDAVEASAVAPIRVQQSCTLSSQMAGLMTNKPIDEVQLNALRIRVQALADCSASFIAFNSSGAEIGAGTNRSVLKVTMTNSTGQRLTTLFTAQ